MKTMTIQIAVFIVITISGLSQTGNAQVYVSGYFKSNGTYVAPYFKSAPDGNPYNNYTYPGNTNPYTGQVASGNPETYLINYYSGSGLNSHTAYPETIGYQSVSTILSNSDLYSSGNLLITPVYSSPDILSNYNIQTYSLPALPELPSLPSLPELPSLPTLPNFR